jgi:molybdopterin-guanine dinucleotide biosynthesis protein A
VILTGGASRRYGRDKAVTVVDGRAMARRVHDAMEAAGVEQITAVGGDGPAIADLGLAWVPDRWPGEGPLGGLITGLEAVQAPWVLVCACDLPQLEARSLRRVLDGRGGDPVDAVVPVVAGHRQTLAACYRRSTRAVLLERWQAGERSMRGALAALTVREVPSPPDHAAAFTDQDTPPGAGRELP